jgi:hypothetical protein
MKNVFFSEPGNYQIELQGQLDSKWFERLGAMRVISPESEIGITTLQGRVSDQTELSGILNTLYDLHLTLISIQYLDDE